MTAIFAICLQTAADRSFYTRGHDGIGRHARFRFSCLRVGVRVPMPAPGFRVRPPGALGSLFCMGTRKPALSKAPVAPCNRRWPARRRGVPMPAPKRKSRASGFFFLVLFSFLSSLFTCDRTAQLFQRRENGTEIMNRAEF